MAQSREGPAHAEGAEMSAVNLTVYERIYMERHRKHMSQSELGAIAGVSRNYISMIERGEADPTIGVLETLMNALGLEMVISVTTKKDGTA